MKLHQKTEPDVRGEERLIPQTVSGDTKIA